MFGQVFGVLGSIPIILLGVGYWSISWFGFVMVIYGIFTASLAVVGFTRISAIAVGISLIIIGGFFMYITMEYYVGTGGGRPYFDLFRASGPFVVFLGVIMCVYNGVYEKRKNPMTQ